MKALQSVVIFALGAATGVVVTRYFLEIKYQEIADEEINSMKEAYERKVNDLEKTEDDRNESPKDDDPSEVAKKARQKPSPQDVVKKSRTDYTAFYTKTDKKEEIKKELENKTEYYDDDEIRPKVISPDEYGSDDDYELITLYYFADGFLCDDQEKPVEDIEGTVGFDSLEHFGEFEDDSVFVRNYRQKADYEILKDPRKYRELDAMSPMEG